jgi:hypothetical protein
MHPDKLDRPLLRRYVDQYGYAEIAAEPDRRDGLAGARRTISMARSGCMTIPPPETSPKSRIGSTVRALSMNSRTAP